MADKLRATEATSRFIGVLACMAAVGLEVQDLLDVLTSGLSGRRELLPDVRGTSGIPPLYAIRESHVDPLGFGLICLGDDAR
jgi:hypothetical protein